MAHALLSSSTWLLVGLGNPGSRYAKHRHNVGFMVLDRFAQMHAAQPWQSAFQGEVSRCQVAGQDVRLCKPQTMMNLSGLSVAKMAKYYQIEPACVVVVHDELDLPLGRVRFKVGGGSGGHRGIASILEHFPASWLRLRCGIGRPQGRQPVADFVLSPFGSHEQTQVGEMFDLTQVALESLLIQGLSKTMAQIHPQA